MCNKLAQQTSAFSLPLATTPLFNQVGLLESLTFRCGVIPPGTFLNLRLIFLSGLVGTDETGKLVTGGLEAETHAIFRQMNTSQRGGLTGQLPGQQGSRQHLALHGKKERNIAKEQPAKLGNSKDVQGSRFFWLRHCI